MIIDSHVHFGKALSWDLGKNEVIESMNKYSIDYAIVSNLAACEFGSEDFFGSNHIMKVIVRQSRIFLKRTGSISAE